MSRKLALSLLGVLALVAAFAVGRVSAQRDGTIDAQTGKFVPFGEPIGPVLSGADVGLQRIATMPDPKGRVRVRWMIKLNGEWREATTTGPTITPAR